MAWADRDLVVRGLAEHANAAELRARDIMTPEVFYLYEDDSIRDAAELMRSRKVRRLIVVDEDKNLAGILSLGDLALETRDEKLAGRTLESISSRGLRSGARHLADQRFGMSWGRALLGVTLVALGYFAYDQRSELDTWARKWAA